MPNHTRRGHHVGQSFNDETQTKDWIALLQKRTIVRIGDCRVVDGSPDTYAQITHCGKLRPAHRLVYELLHGDLDDDMVVHHQCFTPGCINPKHLEAMTNGEHFTLHRRLNRAA